MMMWCHCGFYISIYIIGSVFVIGYEKMTLMAQNNFFNIFYVGLKLQVCSLFCSLFQEHSMFRCVVMCANAKRCSQTQKR